MEYTVLLSISLKRLISAVFYFVGHGFEVNGQCYLLPVDAPLEAHNPKVRLFPFFSHFLGKMDRKGRISVLYLDGLVPGRVIPSQILPESYFTGYVPTIHTVS